MSESSIQSILDASLVTKLLHAYAARFGIPTSEQELEAIAGSIVSFQLKKMGLEAKSEQITQMIGIVVAQFRANAGTPNLINAAENALAEEIQQWKTSLEHQVLSTLQAYIQQVRPAQLPNLPELILSIVPLVESSPLSPVTVESILQRVQSQFDWQTALRQVVGQEAFAIAQQVIQLLQYDKLETFLKETIVAYKTQFNQTLETVTESLVNTALDKIWENRIHLDIETAIDEKSKQFLVKQVTLKMNLIQASSQPSKSAQEMATQLDQEIEKFRREHQVQLDITQPKQTGDLEVG